MRALPPPVALTIAGSDNSAGAGIQADLKTFGAMGVYGLTAVTCVVAEVPGRVQSMQAVAASVVRDQISSSLEAFPVRAIKTGLLHSSAIVELVADLYGAIDATTRTPLVIDPVMVSSSGTALLAPAAVAAYLERLFFLATLVTPNLDEASALLARSPIMNVEEMRAAGRELAESFGVPFLLKGGHLVREKQALDILFFPDGKTHDYALPFIPGPSLHGTGCTYSAAITAGLASGDDLPTAITNAKDFTHSAIRAAFQWHDTRALRQQSVASPSHPRKSA